MYLATKRNDFTQRVGLKLVLVKLGGNMVLVGNRYTPRKRSIHNKKIILWKLYIYNMYLFNFLFFVSTPLLG